MPKLQKRFVKSEKSCIIIIFVKQQLQNLIKYIKIRSNMIDGIKIEDIKSTDLLLRFKMIKLFMYHYKNDLKTQPQLCLSEKIGYSNTDEYVWIIRQLQDLQNFIIDSTNKIKLQQSQSLALINQEIQKTTIIKQEIKNFQSNYENSLMKIWRKMSDNNKKKIEKVKSQKNDCFNNQKFAYLTSDIMKMERTAYLKVQNNRQKIKQVISQLQQMIKKDNEVIQLNYNQISLLIDAFRLKINQNIAKYKQFCHQGKQKLNQSFLQVQSHFLQAIKQEEQLRTNNMNEIKCILMELKNKIGKNPV